MYVFVCVFNLYTLYEAHMYRICCSQALSSDINVCMLHIIMCDLVFVCFVYLGLNEVGIYRVAGVMRDVDELRRAFDTGEYKPEYMIQS